MRLNWPSRKRSGQERSHMNETTQSPDDLEESDSALPTGRPGDDAGQGPELGGGTPVQSSTKAIFQEILNLKKERDELRDQALRVRAEFANFQKRSKQQADADRVYAVGSLARDLLDPLDNFERANDALRAAGDGGISSGLDMVRKQLIEILAKHGIEPIAALGRPFDPNLHDAILQQPSVDHPEGTIVAELGKGYKIGDRVLRPTKVAVSVKPRADSD
jgi:molecular chaperone GrpE